jgi:D-alanyl-lipoteichoic acid acyltransferase DltB (MBOAT superfamily)
MLSGLITIAGGILAASALIVARKPNAKDLIDKLTPYQGWIGIVMFLWGIYATFTCVRYIGVLSDAPILWTLSLASAVADLVVGFLLGFGLITKYTLDGNPVARARGQQLRERLARYQGAFGLLAIAMGTLYILWPYVA